MKRILCIGVIMVFAITQVSPYVCANGKGDIKKIHVKEDEFYKRKTNPPSVKKKLSKDKESTIPKVTVRLNEHLKMIGVKVKNISGQENLTKDHRSAVVQVGSQTVTFYRPNDDRAQSRIKFNSGRLIDGTKVDGNHIIESQGNGRMVISESGINKMELIYDKKDGGWRKTTFWDSLAWKLIAGVFTLGIVPLVSYSTTPKDVIVEVVSGSTDEGLGPNHMYAEHNQRKNTTPPVSKGASEEKPVVDTLGVKKPLVEQLTKVQPVVETPVQEKQENFTQGTGQPPIVQDTQQQPVTPKVKVEETRQQPSIPVILPSIRNPKPTFEYTGQQVTDILRTGKEEEVKNLLGEMGKSGCPFVFTESKTAVLMPLLLKLVENDAETYLPLVKQAVLEGSSNPSGIWFVEQVITSNNGEGNEQAFKVIAAMGDGYFDTFIQQLEVKESDTVDINRKESVLFSPETSKNLAVIINNVQDSRQRELMELRVKNIFFVDTKYTSRMNADVGYAYLDKRMTTGNAVLQRGSALHTIYLKTKALLVKEGMSLENEKVSLGDLEVKYEKEYKEKKEKELFAGSFDAYLGIKSTELASTDSETSSQLKQLIQVRGKIEKVNGQKVKIENWGKSINNN